MKKLLHKLPMHVYHLDICVEILVDYEVLQTSPFTAFWKLPTQNCQFYLQKFLKGFEHYIAKTGYRCQSKSKTIAQRSSGNRLNQATYRGNKMAKSKPNAKGNIYKATSKTQIQKWGNRIPIVKKNFRSKS